MLPHGRVGADAPKCRLTARWVKVPSGPRYATRTPASSDRQALMISWKTGRMAEAGNGPGLAAWSRSTMARSRPGT